ncbi:MAG: SWIM zinc finger family protein [Chloroflexia bacterium]|nr:SWIM zinc finger family protein [Chloroflexia bacterium]
MPKRRSSYYDGYWPRYTPTRPIEVEGGIKAKSRSGKFVKNWWADRWIAALKRLMDSGRLGRGRSYARRGQVLEIKVETGRISARVQGSRRTPYKVSIQLQPLSKQQWEQVFDVLAEQAIFAAQLLNGEMPADIEQVFDAAEVPLFPSSRGDLQTDCSCPDWANPCKHIAAVYYLLGERFDEDPFLLFELRGRGKEQVAAALRERRIQGMEETSLPAYVPEAIEAVEVVALEQCLEHYWDIGAEAETVVLSIAGPKVDMALLKRLGVPDFLEARSFWAQMERVHDGVTARALEVAFAESEQEQDLRQPM